MKLQHPNLTYNNTDISTIWIDNARIVAIFFVVILHVAAESVLGNKVGTTHWWAGNLYDSFSRWSVPIFVMISGALLLDPDRKENLKIFYGKRVSRVLTPIIFWSIFFLAWSILKETTKGHIPSVFKLTQSLISGRPYFHMWFLYMMTILYLFTPFFKKIVSNSNRKEVAAFVVFTFSIAVLNTVHDVLHPSGPQLFINLFFSYIPYFFLGHLIRSDDQTYSNIMLWGVFFFFSTLTAVGCYITAIYSNLNLGLYFYEYLSITVIPMSVSVIYLFKSWKNPIISTNFTKLLSVLTMGIYLIHPIFLDMVKYLQPDLFNFYPSILIPVISITIFIFSLISSWVINQIPYLRRIV